MFYIEKSFSDAITKLKLNKDIVLFIDGIDIRPDIIPYIGEQRIKHTKNHIYMRSQKNFYHISKLVMKKIFLNAIFPGK